LIACDLETQERRERPRARILCSLDCIVEDESVPICTLVIRTEHGYDWVHLHGGGGGAGAAVVVLVGWLMLR
jgi:hypothetical protein